MYIIFFLLYILKIDLVLVVKTVKKSMMTKAEVQSTSLYLSWSFNPIIGSYDANKFFLLVFVRLSI